MTLASCSTRLLGQFLDWMIAITPFIVVAINLDPEQASGEILFFAALVFGAGYYLFSDALPGGQSWAKKLLGIAVINQHTGVPCTAFQSFLRNVLQPILGGLDWIFIIGSRRQRLGDMLAGTIVVEKASLGSGTEWDVQASRTSRQWVLGSVLGALLLCATVAAMTAPGTGDAANALAQPGADGASLVQDPRLIVSTDGRSRITVPGSWRTLPEIGPLYEIRVGNINTAQFLAAHTNSRDSVPMGLEAFAELALKDYQKMVANATPSAPRPLRVRGHAAIQYEITDPADVTWLTVIQTERHYHRVLAWTALSRGEQSWPLFQEIISSFQETAPPPPASAPATDPDAVVSTARLQTGTVAALTESAGA